MRRSNENDFWERLIIDQYSGCMEWSGYLSNDGYGILSFKGNNWRAHRLAYTLIFGEIPKGMNVCHRCDNPKCANPEHLFIGTQLDNIKDRVNKKRCGDHKGVANGRAKLSEKKVQLSRHIFSNCNITKASLGKMFGVSDVQICNIINNKSWSHIK